MPTPDKYSSYDDYLAAIDRGKDFVTVGAKIDSGRNRQDYVILGKFLYDMVPSLVKDSYLLCGREG